MWDGGFGMGGGWTLGWIVIMAVLVLIVVGIVLLVRGLSNRHDQNQTAPQGSLPGGPGPGSALQILQERYARGEIDRDEFMKRKADLLS